MDMHICPEEVKAASVAASHLMNYACGCVWNAQLKEWVTRCLNYWFGGCKDTRDA